MPMDEMAQDPELDVLVVGTAGRAGLEPTLAALERGVDVALANKEVVVMAGHLLRAAADRGQSQLRPVDSEHSAIWQCLWGEENNEIRRIILTASGGALRDLPEEALRDVTPAQALNHPTWNMGAKITVDSASLMNKGMETIEARWLFDVPYDRVEVLQHPESIVHSLVEMGDGSVKAQLGNPDMRLPIQCALCYPARLSPTVEPLDLAKLGSLHFQTPEFDRYPCLQLAMQAGEAAGTYPTVMAAADEIAVQAFLEEQIRFTDIPSLIETVMSAHDSTPDPSLDAIDAADAWARRRVTTALQKLASA
jgi:1-deoxy-D-xylulose-5-phosphate reductoisomerase